MKKDSLDVAYHKSFLDMVKWFVKEFGFAALLLAFAMGSLSIGVGIQFYADMSNVAPTAIITRASDPQDYLGESAITGTEAELTEPIVEQTAVDTSFLRYELYSRGFYLLIGGLILFAVAGALAYVGMTRNKRHRPNAMGLV
jgi:hypothetical protein